MRILIIDDQALFVHTLKNFIQDFKNVDEVIAFTSVIDARKFIDKNCPDIVILDYEMPEMSGVDAIKFLLSVNPKLKILILSTHFSPLLVNKCLSAGAKGYHSKSIEPEILEESLTQLHRDGYVFNKEVQSILNEVIAPYNSARIEYPEISKRELEVLELICAEFTMKEIADKLYLSDKTIQNHRQSLLKKFLAKNTAGLVKKAIEYGFISVNKLTFR